MVKIFTGTLYSCPCGYETLSAAGSLAHSKTKKCIQHTMVKIMTEFVTKSEYDTKGSDASAVSIEGDHNIAIGRDNNDNSDNSVNINFVLPERTTKEDFMEYLLAMDHLGFRTPEQVAAMPGKLLMFTRGAKELPGAIIERNKKIIEKLPDGTERIMGKKKAIQTYTHEAVDALCWRPPAHGVSDFLETERGDKRTKVSIQDAAKLRVTNPRGYHHGVPDDVKHRHQKIESHTEKALDKITMDNKLDGFL
jgi:hypothetical protein